MRTKSWKDVLAAIKPEGAAAGLGGMGDFGPIADNKVVFSDYKARSAAGNFIKRPMLVGNNDNEIALFAVILGQTAMLSSPTIKAAGGAFGCPSGSAAKARADNKVKSWRYLYAAEWPNQLIAPKAGAWHGSEIGAVFGSTEYQQEFYGKMTNQSINIPDTPAQKQLIKTMMTAWTNFAKDPENALEKLGWPVYDPSSKSQRFRFTVTTTTCHVLI
jgi:carboxylesterase type B